MLKKLVRGHLTRPEAQVGPYIFCIQRPCKRSPKHFYMIKEYKFSFISHHQTGAGDYRVASLFVFSIDGLKQNAGSLMTHVSYTVFYALSYGTLGFALHGSFFNHSLIGGNSSTANQIL